MRIGLFGLLVIALVGVSGAAHADRIDHFKGKPSATLEQAVSHFSEYNKRLARALKEADRPEALGEIHQLTYTLENALEKLREELAELAETLEAVHVASETGDVKSVKQQGNRYLSGARKIIP